MGLFIFPIISSLSQVAVVVVVLLVRRALPREMKVLAVYFVLSLVVGLVQVSLAFARIPNVWTSQFFLPVEVSLLLLVFYFAPVLSRLRSVVLACIIVFVALWAWSTRMTMTFPQSFPFAKTGAAVLLVGVSCYVLILLMNGEDGPWSKQPLFWVASGNVVYFASTAIFYAFSAAIFQASMPTMRLVMAVQAVMNTIANLIYLKGFWCLHQK